VRPRAFGGALCAFSLFLQDPFRFLQFPLSGGRKILAGAINEILDHANAGTYPFRTHALLRHCPGDRLGVFGEYISGWIGRNRLDVADPFFRFSHRPLLNVVQWVNRWPVPGRLVPATAGPLRR